MCQVSRTNGSLNASRPHFGHFSTILSIHGRCSSKFGPSGRSFASSIMRFLEKAGVFSPQEEQTQMGRGAPQLLSLVMHQGGDSVRNSRNLFLGPSK